MANLRVSVLFAAALALAVSCSPAFAAAFDLSGFELVAENEHLALYLNEASVEFAKSGTDPKPEDALKNVYA